MSSKWNIAFLALLVCLSPGVASGVYLKNVDKYDKIVIPRENGRQVPISTHQKMYPSRAQWAQFIAFIDSSENSMLMVSARDTNPTYTQQWTVSDNIGTLPCRVGQWCLRIVFHRTVDPPVVETTYHGTTNWEVPAADYKAWAKKQSWYRSHGQLPDRRLSHVMSCATNSYSYYMSTLAPLAARFAPGKVGCFMTQYREFAFDRKYPNYRCSASADCRSWLQNIKYSDNVFALPYINGILWDSSHSGYNAGRMCRDAAGKPRKYDTYLRYVDPLYTAWPGILHDAWSKIMAADGSRAEGVYIDVLAASEPQICHYSGVPRYDAWISGVKAVLSAFDDEIIMVEGISEVYLPYIDIAYISPPATQVAGAIGLFGYIYGDVPGLNVVGMETTASATASELYQYQYKARNNFSHDAMLFSGGLKNELTLKNSLSTLPYYLNWVNVLPKDEQ